MNKGQLALFGGTPVRSKPMPSRHAFDEEMEEAAVQVFRHYRKIGRDFGYQGSYEEIYCKEFAGYHGGGYADAVATGTGSLVVALAALQLPEGSEVLVSPITDPGTLTAIIFNRLTPVLVDSMRGDFGVGVEEVESRITSKTKAAVIVHARGEAAPIREITEICKQKGVLLLEDCSQSHGAEWQGKKVGTFGDIAAFSTMYRKNHSTGASGGVVYAQDLDRYHLARAYADRGKPFWKEGFDDKNAATFLFPALNWNTDEISCAMGSVSLRRLDETRRKRIGFLKTLSDLLQKESKVCRPFSISDASSPFYFPIAVDLEKITVGKEEFAKAVGAEGIDVNPHYAYMVDEWDWVKPYLGDDFKTENARKTRNTSFNLLFNEKCGQQEAEDVVKAILKVESVYHR
jgi:dTDP-4-amino-4,6-dideoxygalactose transaminase